MIFVDGFNTDTFDQFNLLNNKSSKSYAISDRLWNGMTVQIILSKDSTTKIVLWFASFCQTDRDKKHFK